MPGDLGGEALEFHTGAWRPDRVMVSLDDPERARALAEQVGLQPLDDGDTSGLVAFGLPDGMSVSVALTLLEATQGVARARPMGMVQIAAAGRPTDPTLQNANPDACVRSSENASNQWHLDAAGFGLGRGGVDDVIVAVLDTGVAYEDWSAPGEPRFVQAPSLAGVEFASPADFVDGDGHPNDENGHGTHIASLIASSGKVCGAAPGVRIMPIRVLDADGNGDELALIRGIRHATAAGASVINMSLSFSMDYVPSPELRSALAEAYDEKVVLVGAAGNNGLDQVSWPAANPHVIAVAASPRASSGVDDALAGYSNWGGRVDLVAPGGDLGADDDGDGQPDGLLAESIDPSDPSVTGYWYREGTSMAAALVSGAAARLVAAGADDDSVRSALLQSATPGTDDPVAAGRGTGALDATAAQDTFTSTAPKVHKEYVTVLPWMAPTDDEHVRPMVRVTAVSMRGAPADGHTVHGTFRGATTERFSCVLSEGACTAAGSAVPTADEQGQPRALGWSVRVHSLETQRVRVPPASAIGVSGELDTIAGALIESADLAEAALAIGWTEETHETLGPVAEAWSILDLQGGWCVEPHAVVLNPVLHAQLGRSDEALLDLYGTGGSETVAVEDWTLSGSGLATSPMGLRSLRLAVVAANTRIDGSARLNLASLASVGDGVSSVATSGDGVLAGDEVWWVPEHIAAGGWTAEGGYGAAELMVARGALGSVVTTSSRGVGPPVRLGR